MKRSDVPEEQVWNLKDIFVSESEFDKALQQLYTDIENLSVFESRIGASEDDLLAFLQARDAVLSASGRVGSYAMMKFSEDGTDAENQARFARTRQVSQALMQKLTVLRDALLKVSEEQLQKFIQSDGQLSVYRLYLTELADSRAHLLSSEAEAALSAMGQALNAPSTWYRTVTGADIRYQSVPDEDGNDFSVTPFSLMIRVETASDGTFRRRAYDALIAGLKPYHNTLAVSLATEIQKNVAMAKLRGYKSTAEMLLQEGSVMGFPSDNVPVSFFERVPGVILKELAPHMQRYARLRSRVFGVDKLHFSDTKAPAIDTTKQRIPYSQIASTIPEAVSIMGSEYREFVERAFRERWIYRADNIGNLQGAYCNTVPGVHSFVFAPYHDIFYDMFITAHELGHAVHGMFASAEQVTQNRYSSRLFVEAPSTFNEHLLAHYLRQTGGEETRLQTNCLQLFTFHHNFVTHLIEGELLRRLYAIADAGEPLTASVLDKTQMAILQEFWGDTVELDEGAGMTWMRQAHYYSGLYPYTYSVGLTASTVLAERLAAGEDIADAWIRVLKMGGSRHALDLFREVGIEMDSDKPYRKAVSYVGRLIAELEAGLS